MKQEGFQEKVKNLEELVKDQAAEIKRLKAQLSDLRINNYNEDHERQIERFRQLVSQSPSMFVFLDTDGHIFYINDRVTEILGFTSEDLIGKAHIFTADDAEGLDYYKKIFDALSSEGHFSGEIELLKKDGTKIWVNANIAYVLINNQPDCLVGVMQDITAERDLIRQNHENQAMMNSIMDNANVAITLMDYNGYFTFFNKQAEKYLRITQDQINTKSITDLFPYEGPGNLAEVRKIFLNKEPVQIETNYHIEGKELFFEISRIPLFDHNGNVFNVLSVSREITDIKHAEKLARIQRSVDSLHSIAETYEESLQILFDNLFELDWIDAGGLYLLDYDKEILELIFHRGLSNEFIKKTTVYPFDSQNAQVAFRKSPSYITKDLFLNTATERLNQEKITFIASLPLVHKDKVLGLLNLASRHVFDIGQSDRQAVETIALKVSNLIELIKTRMELKRSNDELTSKLQELRVNHQIVLQKSRLESLGELLAGLAHEINQPLSIISLAMENVNYKLADKAATEEYLTHKFSIITNNIRKIRELIDHVRIFSRDQGTIMFEQVNVNSVINNALSMMQSQLRNRQIRVATELSPISGYTLGNPSRLEQVILNLISNARDAVEEKDKKPGSKEEPMEIFIKTTVDRSRISILVRDNGTGISQENLDKIFNPFFTTKATGHGTGLGLPIVYGIIREMKGDIMARSEEGAFTEISISLPHYKNNA